SKATRRATRPAMRPRPVRAWKSCSRRPSLEPCAPAGCSTPTGHARPTRAAGGLRQGKEERMSRGLGAMQRQILASLEAAREAQPSYDRGWVLYRRVDMLLVEGVYDLRVVAKYVRARRQIPAWQGERFAPMFSRACKSLVARGLLQA